MNVLLVSQSYHPAVGGIEAHVRQLAHALLHRGHRVQVVAGTFTRPKLPRRLETLRESLLAPCFEDYDDDGVPVTALTPSPVDRLRMLPAAVRAVPRLQRFAYHGLNRFAYRYGYRPVYGPRLRRLAADADVVHALAGGHIGWAAGEAARAHGVPLVVTPFAHPGQWGDGPDDVRYYCGADAVIGLVDTDREYLRSLGVPAERLHTVGVSPDLPPTVDSAGFRLRRGLGDSPVVLYVGRMMAQKGAASVLAAAQQVWAAVPQARFVFIGPGSPSETSQFIGADSRITYLGKVSAQEKADALAACDVFCMPSMSEILPTVYLEAWSYGKPVVGGRAHGLPELVEGNGAGIAVAQTGGDVAAALIRLLADPALRTVLGNAGRQLVEREYSVTAVTEKLLKLYTRLATNRAPAAAEVVGATSR